MASILDYFSPGQISGDQQPDQGVAPAISTFMKNPQALNALLAFGTQAMIPQWGGGVAQFAHGVGAASHAADAAEASQQKQQELDSKSQLREAQAGKAEAQANTAGTRASLTGLIEEGKSQRANDMNRIRLLNQYAVYTKGVDNRNKLIDAENSSVLKTPGSPMKSRESTMPIEEWYHKNPLVRDTGLMSAPGPKVGAEDDTLPPGATLDSGSTGPATAGRPPTPVGMRQVVKRGEFAGKEVEWDGSQWNLVGK